LSLDRLFEADYRDGGLELLALSELPLELACSPNAPRTGR
jgi:ABC-type transport system involved in cytochrome c biogenesis permease component